jgi:hypothetical protein
MASVDGSPLISHFGREASRERYLTEIKAMGVRGSGTQQERDQAAAMFD